MLGQYFFTFHIISIICILLYLCLCIFFKVCLIGLMWAISCQNQISLWKCLALLVSFLSAMQEKTMKTSKIRSERRCGERRHGLKIWLKAWRTSPHPRHQVSTPSTTFLCFTSGNDNWDEFVFHCFRRTRKEGWPGCWPQAQQWR